MLNTNAGYSGNSSKPDNLVFMKYFRVFKKTALNSGFRLSRGISSSSQFWVPTFTRYMKLTNSECFDQNHSGTIASVTSGSDFDIKQFHIELSVNCALIIMATLDR